MTISNVKVGDVFKITCTFPELHKSKFLILIKTKPYSFFIINSEINQFICNSPELFSCQIDIPYKDHACFLTHDSIAECSHTVDTSSIIPDKGLIFNDLVNYKVGRIKNYILEEILTNLIDVNETIKTKLKNEIIEAIKTQL